VKLEHAYVPVGHLCKVCPCLAKQIENFYKQSYLNTRRSVWIKSPLLYVFPVIVCVALNCGAGCITVALAEWDHNTWPCSPPTVLLGLVQGWVVVSLLRPDRTLRVTANPEASLVTFNNSQWLYLFMSIPKGIKLKLSISPIKHSGKYVWRLLQY
jgi:hypothetical protein